METDACPTCGKPLSTVDLEARHLDHHGHVLPSGAGAEPRLPRTVVLTVLLALVAAVAGVLVLAGGDDGSTADGAADPEAAVPPAPDAAGGEVIEADSVRLEREQREASDALAASIGDHRLAYVGDDGSVVVVEHSPMGERVAVRSDAEVTSSNDVFFDLADYELLIDGNSTFAIHRDNPGQVFELASIGPLVRTEDAFSIGKQVGGTRDEIVVATAAGFWITWVELPVGATTLAVPDLGVLVLPPTGGTFLARPGALEPFSDHRVISATGSHQIEVRCDDDEPLVCEPVLHERATGAVTAVPDAFGAGDAVISIGPDGRWITLVRPGVDLVLDVGTGAVREVDLTDGAVAWGRGGDFLAWLPAEPGAPVLTVFDPATGAEVTVDISALGGPATTGDAVALFR